LSQKISHPHRGLYTRQAIKESFAKCYTKTEFSKITVNEICKRIPVSRNTFYMYFEDINAVLDEIEDDLINGFLTIYDEFIDTNFSDYQLGDSLPIFDDTLFYIKLNMLYFRALIGKSPDYCFVERWKKIIRDSFRERWEKDNIKYKNQELVLEMTASSALGAYTYWVNHEYEVNFIKMSQEISSRLFYEIALTNKNKK
jgi:AcrR family transcriptional regulator